jgi:glutathione S-transferase
VVANFPGVMLRFYDYWESGNCSKVRLLLNQIGQPFERAHLDVLKGETHQPERRSKN